VDEVRGNLSSTIHSPTLHLGFSQGFTVLDDLFVKLRHLHVTQHLVCIMSGAGFLSPKRTAVRFGDTGWVGKTPPIFRKAHSTLNKQYTQLLQSLCRELTIGKGTQGTVMGGGMLHFKLYHLNSHNQPEEQTKTRAIQAV